MGFKPRPTPPTTLHHTLWLQTGAGSRIDYSVRISFERSTPHDGHCVVELDAMPGEWPRKVARFQGDHDLVGIMLASWSVAEVLLLSRAYREGRLTWNGSPTLGLAFPPHLAHLVHESFFVALAAASGDFDKAPLVEGLGTHRCGDSPEEAQFFVKHLADKGSARRLFPTKDRAESFRLIAQSLGIDAELSSARPEIPDPASAHHWAKSD